MTPLAGFVAAIIAGWIIRDPRRAAAAVIVPFAAVLAAQTWILASGRGINPPSTVTFPDAIGYWVFQAFFLAFALGIAAELSALRKSRATDEDLAATSRRTVQASALLVVLAAAFVTGSLLNSSPVLHHNTSSPLPLSGVVGIAADVVSLVVLSVLVIRSRRARITARVAVAGGQQ
jgi:hypothetical protein